MGGVPMLIKSNSISQRDAFWSEIYKIARQDRDVVVISADMGAPALDGFRRNLASQFVNAGIAEQNSTLIASGLAMLGKKAYTYGIAPFITLRCIEQIRVANAIMGIPITVVGVGTGFGYEDSGPTHHLIEDIAMMRSMPKIDIYNVTDAVMATKLAGITHRADRTIYLRIERQVFDSLYDEDTDFAEGLSLLIPGREVLLLSSGTITHLAAEIVDELNRQGHEVGLIDVYRFPINEQLLLEKIRGAKKLFSLEEHFLPGGFGSALAEIMVDNGVTTSLQRLGLPLDRGYCYDYGGREKIHKFYGIDKAELMRTITACLG
jgi:transketolase